MPMLPRFNIQPTPAISLEDKKHRKAYTHQFKGEVAKYFKSSTLKATKRWLDAKYPEHKDLSAGQISRWAKRLPSIEASDGSRKRVKRGTAGTLRDVHDLDEIVEDVLAIEPFNREQQANQHSIEEVLDRQLGEQIGVSIGGATSTAKDRALEAMQTVQSFLHQGTLSEQKRDKAYKHWLALNRILRLTMDNTSQAGTQ